MAITTAPIWLDGAMVDLDDGKIPLMAHAVHRGSLVFDVGSFHATPSGQALFRAPEHVARFRRSAEKLGLAIAYDDDVLVGAAKAVVAASGRPEGLVRWVARFAASEADLIPRSAEASVAVAAQILEDPTRPAPISVATFDDARKAPPEALDPSLKVAAAYVGPMLARRRAKAEGADDVVLIDPEGDVAEAPVANVFAVSSGVLVTPPLRYVLAGITRDSVLELARALGIPAREEPLSRARFRDADEAFLSGTPSGIVPIGRIDGRALSQAPGPVSRRLMDRLDAVRAGRDPAYGSWLEHVQKP